MTTKELIEWAESERPHDDRVYVGKDTTIADVKQAVRQFESDVARLLHSVLEKGR